MFQHSRNVLGIGTESRPAFSGIAGLSALLITLTAWLSASAQPPPPNDKAKTSAKTDGPVASKKEEQPDAGAQRAKERTKRQQRWILVFGTKDGADYAKQLQGLGAILAIPEPDGEKYRVIRDLAKRPIEGKVEDISNMKKNIYWIDDQKDSVESLAKGLGLKQTPKHVIAIFPEKLEQELLHKELAFAGRKEADIDETKFEVRKFRSKDGYGVEAVSQSGKK
jgi:hypothetical protein